MAMATNDQTPIHPLVALCRARNNHARDLRDAAHEIFHARAAGAKKTWEREHVHRRLLRQFRRPAEMWLHEMKARAVEQIVCKHFGHDPGDMKGWVEASALEAIRNRLPYAEPEGSYGYALDFMSDSEVVAEAQAIIALAAKKE